ncbi:MAG: glycine--tRNA ligase subunit beta, partial [Planctomycetes bacterium]|nr:glycine--tRNA ligase subunit beta [Planctomycetota bacterium]
TLEEWIPRLGTLTFHEKLGSFAEVAQRLEKLVFDLAERTGTCSSKEERRALQRAAKLSKADMVTRVVTEFPYLAGTMGAIYGRAQGESDAVATCIEEQYLPTPGSKRVPQTAAGRLLSMADKLDKLTGLFAIGVRPKGTADPYALRRDALGLLVLLQETGQRLSVTDAIRAAAKHLPVDMDENAIQETAEFVRRRLTVVLSESFQRVDVVNAAVAGSGDDPVRCREAAAALSDAVRSDGWDALLTAYARCVRLVRTQGGSSEAVEPATLEEPSEKALWNAVSSARERLGSDASSAAIVGVLQELVTPINAFFDAVMVMAEDEAVRRNRLGLLAAVAELTAGWADLSLLEGF